MLTRANSVCVLALSRSDWRVLALLLVRVDCATLCSAVLRCAVLCCAVLCCAVLCCAVLAEQKSNEIQESFPTNNIIVGNYRLRRAERWEKIATISSPSRRDLSLFRLPNVGDRFWQEFVERSSHIYPWKIYQKYYPI